MINYFPTHLIFICYMTSLTTYVSIETLTISEIYKLLKEKLMNNIKSIIDCNTTICLDKLYTIYYPYGGFYFLGKTSAPVVPNPVELSYWRFYKNNNINNTYFLVNPSCGTVLGMNLIFMSFYQTQLCPSSNLAMILTYSSNDGTWTLTKQISFNMFYISSSSLPHIVPVYQNLFKYTPSKMEKAIILALKGNDWTIYRS